ncbi:sigma-54 interaction domain-containing protein [Paenibacillus tyrfis]|uniref:sigma-54 interaction domain-containing protein n=1 Tax=Paenibacillus tyrfis TaxID=1501230 RepID=UPI0020A1529B|nr:sigma 54-interacting transcriptional regulator [Paenibacillus tyrfis]MCP1312400.1 sigma 54-interacting transcriptional regulator [Paenibacillus tyrfis]
MYRTPFFQTKNNDELLVLISSIFNTSNDGLFICDKNGYPLLFNQALLDISGCSPDVFHHYGIFEIVEEGLVPTSCSIVAIETRQPYSKVITYYNGKTANATAIPFLDSNNEIIFVVSNVKDVTDINRLHEELEETRQINLAYQKILEQIQEEVGRSYQLIYRSKNMHEVVSLASRFAKNDSPLLILGESGVGKDVLAEYIHQKSERKGKLIKINCGAIPEHLLESELFGYEKGAFTGATQSKAGLLELAHEGTIFLDEIGDLPFSLQVKLLTVLQDSKIRRVGGTETREVNMRVIAATNCDLHSLVEQKKFRQDLYYRLNVLTVNIPPLRERQDDISALLFYYLKKLEQKYKVEKKLDNYILEKLLDYSWPGNIRELKNIVERMYHMSEDEKITLEHLPFLNLNSKQNRAIQDMRKKSFVKQVPLKKAIAEFEKEYITQILRQSSNLNECCEKLEVSIATLIRRKKSLGIQ